jgi:outer membrane protein TolC
MKKSITGLLLAFSLAAFSQSSDQAMQFSIKQAVDYSFEHQVDVLNAQLDNEIAKAQVKEVIGMGLPQLSASFDLKDYIEIPTSLIPAEFFGGPAGSFAAIKFGTRYNATAGVNASQLIFEPSYLVGVQAAKTVKELSRKNVDRTKLEAAVAVTKAYYMVLLMRDRKKVIDANVTRLEKYNSDVKAMYDNGFVEKIDADRIQVAYNNILSEKENFERIVTTLENTLKFQMGLSPSTNIILTDSLNADAMKNLSISLDKAAPEKRIEYSLLKTQEQIQLYNVKRYKAQYLPSLVAYGSINANAQRPTFTVFDPSYRWFPVGLIGATLSINLFDGLTRENKIRHENLNLRKIKNQLTAFSNGVELEVSSSRSNLASAIASLNTQGRNLDLAENVNKTSKIKYDQGVGSNLELLTSETALKEAQSNYFNALYDAIIAKIDLDKALGNFTY